MPVIPPPPPGPIAGQPGHFAWTEWAEDALVSLSRTPAMAAGSVTVTGLVSNTPTSYALTFPVGRFSVAPTVVVGLNTTVPGTVVLGCAATSITATGCLLWVTRTTNSNTGLFWIAIEKGL